ncbi:MAG TPA: sulfotransferase [Solirubrobacteraceae bacterium]
MTVELIGAGLPRTGTLTQKEALELIGLGPCYHWVDVLADLDKQVPLWDGALDGRVEPAQILDGYRSTVDWPGGYFYAQLLDAYPDSKVLLSVRDAERWEPSFRETIVDMCFGDALIHLLSSARAHVDPKWKRYVEFVDRMFWSELGTFPDGHSREALIEGFDAHNERVKQVVPEERLLVWEVTDGWEPLCEFLEVPVPSQPMPHANDRATFLDRVIGGALTTLEQWRETQRAQP